MRRSDFEDLASHGVLIFGDTEFRGKCPPENLEQITFFSRLRLEYPDTLGQIALHPRNEGLKKGGQFSAVSMHRAEGMTKGAADIIIPAKPSFVCELKRQDYTKCDWEDGQREFLIASANVGGFACVAFGHKAAFEALEYWLALCDFAPEKVA